jgi:hypothetical protein
MHTTARRRLALLTLTITLVALALAPLSANARVAAPVLTASSAGNYASTDGGCADVQFFSFIDASAPLISANPAVFGFDGSNADRMQVNGTFSIASMGQRVFVVSVAAVTIENGSLVTEVFWEGLAALKCLSGGVMQFAFKPFEDFYFAQPLNSTEFSACGDLGGNARVVATVNPTTGAFDFAVYAPVTPHAAPLDHCPVN